MYLCQGKLDAVLHLNLPIGLTNEGREAISDCGHHASSRTLVAKAFRASFFWPKALADAKYIVDHCTECQFYASQPHKPASELKTIPLAWPFPVWGLDMTG